MSIKNSVKRCGARRSRETRATDVCARNLSTHLAVCKLRRVDLAAARDDSLQRRQELVNQTRQKDGCRLQRDWYVARLLGSLGVLALLVAPVLLQLRMLRELQL